MSVLRRSFVQPRLIAAGASFITRDGASVAEAYHRPLPDPLPLGLADLSPLRRTGFKGRGGFHWLEDEGWPVPELDNRAGRCPSGALVARLAEGEVLALDAIPKPDPRLARAETTTSLPAGLYPVPRRDSHAWFVLLGARAPECLATLCAVDLRPQRFADLAIAQTSLARLAAIVIRDDGDGEALRYHLLADSASALYLWDVLVDAMSGYGGRLMGLGDVARR